MHEVRVKEIGAVNYPGRTPWSNSVLMISPRKDGLGRLIITLVGEPLAANFLLPTYRSNFRFDQQSNQKENVDQRNRLYIHTPYLCDSIV
jgi:hypothetical protein